MNLNGFPQNGHVGLSALGAVPVGGPVKVPVGGPVGGPVGIVCCAACVVPDKEDANEGVCAVAARDGGAGVRAAV